MLSNRLEACNLSKENIVEVAERIHQQLVEWFDFTGAGDLRKVVRNLGGGIIYDNPFYDMNPSIEVRAPLDFTIYLPSYTPDLWNCFTIAHELGHYFLHSQQGKIPGIGPRDLSDLRLEWEANWFAANLLMPIESFNQAWAEYDHDVEAVADYFMVRDVVVTNRAQQLGWEQGWIQRSES